MVESSVVQHPGRGRVFGFAGTTHELASFAQGSAIEVAYWVSEPLAWQGSIILASHRDSHTAVMDYLAEENHRTLTAMALKSMKLSGLVYSSVASLVR